MKNIKKAFLLAAILITVSTSLNFVLGLLPPSYFPIIALGPLNALLFVFKGPTALLIELILFAASNYFIVKSRWALLASSLWIIIGIYSYYQIYHIFSV